MEVTLERDNGEITSPSIRHTHTPGRGPSPPGLGPAQEFSSSCAKPSLHSCPWQASRVSSAARLPSPSCQVGPRPGPPCLMGCQARQCWAQAGTHPPSSQDSLTVSSELAVAARPQYG